MPSNTVDLILVRRCFEVGTSTSLGLVCMGLVRCCTSFARFVSSRTTGSSFDQPIAAN